MTQPKALRLADRLSGHGGLTFVEMHAAASELRRLHAENERLRVDGIHSCHAECQRPVCRLTRERGALLEALRPFAAVNVSVGFTQKDVDRARAAIKAVEEWK